MHTFCLVICIINAIAAGGLLVLGARWAWKYSGIVAVIAFAAWVFNMSAEMKGATGVIVFIGLTLVSLVMLVLEVSRPLESRQARADADYAADVIADAVANPRERGW